MILGVPWWAAVAAVLLGTVAGNLAAWALVWLGCRLLLRRAVRRAEDTLVAAYSRAGQPPK